MANCRNVLRRAVGVVAVTFAPRREGFELPRKSHYKVEVASANRKAIEAYFRSHVGTTRGECAKALGLDRRTVERHIAALRSAWANGAVTAVTDDIQP